MTAHRRVGLVVGLVLLVQGVDAGQAPSAAAQELSAAEKRALLQTPAASRIPEPLRSFCCDATPDASDDLPDDVRLRRRENRIGAVAALRREGVLAGSDTGNP